MQTKILNFETEKKTVNGTRQNFNQRFCNFEKNGFKRSDFKNMPKDEGFYLNSIFCRNKDFKRMKATFCKKTGKYYLIQGQIINELTTC